MGLFQKKTTPITTKLYTLGSQETILIVGLGNIGTEYTGTRHNFGFMVIDEYALHEEFNGWIEKKDLKSILCAKIIDGKKVILCKPTTYMNLSGEAIQLVQNFYKISDKNTVIVYDELDLDLGTLRTGRGGQSAGHNGIKSLIKHTHNEFWRIRLGIGPKKPAEIDSADFVLQKFSKTEASKLPAIATEAENLLSDYLASSGDPDTETRTAL